MGCDAGYSFITRLPGFSMKDSRALVTFVREV